MIPERRLDQLEPLLAEVLAVLDQHTALLEQHTALHRQTQAQVRQLAVVVSTINQPDSPLAENTVSQGDTTDFLVEKQAHHAVTQFDAQETKFVTIKNRMNRVECAINRVDIEVADVKVKLSSLEEKLSSLACEQIWAASSQQQILSLVRDRLK